MNVDPERGFVADEVLQVAFLAILGAGLGLVTRWEPCCGDDVPLKRVIR